MVFTLWVVFFLSSVWGYYLVPLLFVIFFGRFLCWFKVIYDGVINAVIGAPLGPFEVAGYPSIGFGPWVVGLFCPFKVFFRCVGVVINSYTSGAFWCVQYCSVRVGGQSFDLFCGLVGDVSKGYGM